MSCGDNRFCDNCPVCGAPSTRIVFPTTLDTGERLKQYLCLECLTRWGLEEYRLNEVVVEIEERYRDKHGLWGERLQSFNVEQIFRTLTEVENHGNCVDCLDKKFPHGLNRFDKRGTYCSTDCRNFYHEILKKMGNYRPFTRHAEIRCCLCGGKGDREGKGWSVDREVPVSKGGLEFDRGNMQPAHLHCNLSKGNDGVHPDQATFQNFRQREGMV